MYELRAVRSLLVMLAFLALPVPGAGQSEGAGTGEVVGTIEVVTDAGTRTFQVQEGPPSEGFSTGYAERPMGEAMALTVSLYGQEQGGSAEMLVQTGIYRDSSRQICDPMSNNVELHRGSGESRLRLRPGGSAPATCPDNIVDIEVTDATFDPEAGTLHLVGTFSGPLGQGGDAIQVSEGRFEATVRSFQDL